MSVPHLVITKKFTLAKRDYLTALDSKPWVVRHELAIASVVIVILLTGMFAIATGRGSILIDNFGLTMILILISFLAYMVGAVLLRERYWGRLKKAQFDLVCAVLGQQGFSYLGTTGVRTMHQASEETCSIVVAAGNGVKNILQLTVYYNCKTGIFSLEPDRYVPSYAIDEDFGRRRNLEQLLQDYQDALGSLIDTSDS